VFILLRLSGMLICLFLTKLKIHCLNTYPSLHHHLRKKGRGFYTHAHTYTRTEKEKRERVVIELQWARGGRKRGETREWRKRGR
jgi:hypothetical protein